MTALRTNWLISQGKVWRFLKFTGSRFIGELSGVISGTTMCGRKAGLAEGKVVLCVFCNSGLSQSYGCLLYTSDAADDYLTV